MKKRGFTLIELLAVIVILAIIALIATPIVLNIINTSKKGAARESSKVYAKEVENYIILKEINDDENSQKLEANKKYYVSEESKIIDDDPSIETVYLENLIEVKGETPQLGYVELNGESRIKSYKLLYGNYMVEYTEPNNYKIYKYSYNNPILKEFNLEQVGPIATISIKASNYNKSYYSLDNSEYTEFKNNITINNLKVGEEHILNIKLVKDDVEVIKSKKIGWIIAKEIIDGKEYNLLNNEYDLDWFRNQVNNGKTDLNAKLEKDIDLNIYSNWTPIGDYNTSENNVYTGIFDGNNKAIRNLKIISDSVNYQGLFGYIKEGGIVKNLTLEGKINVTNGGRIGGFAGQSEGIIENCINKADITGGYFVGGITGINLYSGSLVKNSKNYGDVKGTGSSPNDSRKAYIGGISGHISTSSKIESSENYGNINSTIGMVGGIVGQIANDSLVDNSINKGSVTALYVVGGISGQLYNGSSVKNSKNYGNINGTGNDPDYTNNTYAGGVAGMVAKSTIESSENYGNVTALKQMVAGITSDLNNSTISSCFNYSTISTSLGYAAGIVGYAYNSSTVENSGNSGKIIGDNISTYASLAGVVARSVSSTVNTSFNRGDITVTNGKKEYRMGGIIGNCASCNINDSYNVATLSGNKASYSDAGGIVGHTDSGTATITNSYSISTLVAARTGDVIGYGSKDLTNVYTSNPDVSKLGSKFCKDEKNINGGYPVLCFEN